jgi:anti-sigma factor RsiW
VTDVLGKFDATDLSAYVDGELDDNVRREAAAWIARDPRAAETVAAYQVHDAALRRAFAGSEESDLVNVLVSRQPARPARRLALRAAAALLFAVIGFGGIYLAERQPASDVPAFAARAAAAYVAYGPDFSGHQALTIADRTLLDRWLSQRLGESFVSPDFTADGFALIDADVVADGDGPAAQLVYRDGQNRLLAFYVKIDPSDTSIPTPAPGQSRFSWIKQDNRRICFWADGPYRLALTGDFDREQMLKLAKQIAPRS